MTIILIVTLEIFLHLLLWKLPQSRTYDSSRKSKVYIKQLTDEREIDAQELLWDVAVGSIHN